MCKRTGPGPANLTLAIGLTLSAFGLFVAMPRESSSSEQKTVLSAPVQVAPRAFPSWSVQRDDGGTMPDVALGSSIPDHGQSSTEDARDELMAAAADSRGPRFSGLERAQTETSYWVNSPAFSGSTSPP